MTTTATSFTCPWCRFTSDGSRSSCPNCGAPVDATIRRTDSGWYELPPIRDMAQVWFGRSSLQVEGLVVPVVDVALSEGDRVVFPHHGLLWKDAGVAITKTQLRGGWNRSYRGFSWYLADATGPGHVAFSRDEPGELVAVPLQPGQSIDAREHVMLLAGGDVTYDWFDPHVWISTRNGDDTEYHYPLGRWMDRFTATRGPGLVLLHAGGNAYLRALAAGESILVKPSALLYRDPGVQMQLHLEHPAGTWRSWRSWGERYLWLRLTGPGRVSIQSAYPGFEDSGRSLAGHSPATVHRWG